MRTALAMTAFITLTTLVAAQTPLGGGTAVGTPVRVGSLQPKVGTNVGKAVGYTGPDGKAINTQKPPGTVVDMTNLAAPLLAPLPGMEPPKSAFQVAYDKWKAMLGFSKPTADLSTNWVPGISRRNRDRHKQDWRRD